MPYGAQVTQALSVLGTLAIDTICPSHGVMWRTKEDISKIINLYIQWSQYKSALRAVIIYDTMWHSTEKMAVTLCEYLSEQNITVKVYSLANTDISDIITEVMFSRFVLVGSPILNNNILPTMAAYLTYMKGLKPKNRLGFTFGSYGWSTAGFKALEDSLKESGIELIAEGKYVNFIPDDSDLESLKTIVSKIKAVIK
jgi:flavorubredoxin